MSELKRVAPQTLEFSSTLGNANKKEKGEKGKQLAPSFRFELSVDDKNEKGYTEFNYAHLLKTAEKKRNKEVKSTEENPANGLDPFDDDDDHEKLREIAKRFETKYGGTTVGKNRKKYDDDVDLGAGYDENDSFIDNTDAYDEVVPEGVTTAYGGFYINSGPLEFSVKAAERNSLLHRNNNNNNNNDNHENESSESSDDEIDNSNSSVSKRRDARCIISSSDDDEPEEVTSEPPAKKSKIDENGEKKSQQISDNINKKKKKLINEQDLERDNNYSRIKNNFDDKRETLEIDITTDNNDDKKKSKYDLNKKDKKFDIKKFEKKSTTNGIDDKKISDAKKVSGKDKLSGNIDDAIESVVNDGKIDDESSRDTVYSSKSRCGAVGTSSEGEDNDRSELSLIEQLPDEIKDIINQLRKLAANRKEGKIKFFDTTVNSTLLLLEKNLRKLDSSTARSQVYSHIGYILDVGKVTLLNRAKKLCFQDAENRVKEPMQRLKAIIESVMPTAVEKFNAECQRVTEEKSFPPSISDADSSEVDDKMLERSKIPRKRFPWTSEARKLVCEIGTQWRQYYSIRKPRKVSMESFVGSFMQSKVLPLWPNGWMKLDILMKYSNVEQSVKRKQKKRDTTIPNNVSSTSVTTNCSSLEMNSTNPTDNEKTSSNYVKTYSDTINQIKSSDIIIDKKQNTTKYKEKHKEIVATSQVDNSQLQPIAKISVVPTAQLMAQKPKNHDKFNPMDLTSTSLSITPVNDYQKTTKPINEIKKDVVSITPYSESSVSVINDSSNKNDSINYTANQNSSTKPAPMKQRLLHDNDGKTDKRIDESERKRERWHDDKQKSQESKKRRKEQKLLEASINAKVDLSGLIQQPLLSREEQEQRQIEETMAATNYLSQIINDDSPRLNNDKRKDTNLLGDDGIGIVQPSEQEKDVQMVMRSLKELQELQLPKPSNQYASYNDDYHRIYHKKDDKLRVSKDDQW